MYDTSVDEETMICLNAIRLLAFHLDFIFPSDLH